MAIKNSLSGQKNETRDFLDKRELQADAFLFKLNFNWLIIFLFAISTACSTGKKTSDSDSPKTESRSNPINPMAPPTTNSQSGAAPSDAAPTAEVPNMPATPTKAGPKIGLILGPGGIKSFAHVGVLKELSRAQIPIHAVVGLEWGAVMAGIYSIHGQGNETEWKSFRLKEDEWVSSQFLGKKIKTKSSTDLKEFLGIAFGETDILATDRRFNCPAYNPKTGKVLWFNRGRLADITSRCLSYPPFYQHPEEIYGFANGVVDAALQLRKMGATHVILIQVLQGPMFPKDLETENYAGSVLWEEVRRSLAKPKLDGVDYTVSVDSSSFNIIGFDQRQGLVDAGQKSANGLLKYLHNEFGF